MAFRYVPHRDTIIIPECNTMTVDPMVGSGTPPVNALRLGLDCPIPLVGDWNCHTFDTSAACDLGEPPAVVTPMTEDALAKGISVPTDVQKRIHLAA
jgi:2,5-furandicarboxylate decarboxylase 1